METYDSLFTTPETPEEAFSPEQRQAWGEKKQAERQQLYQLIDDTAMAMAQDGAKFQAGLDVMARFDRYSVGNVLLVSAQMPNATRLGDFDYWKQNRTYVRKGAKNIQILEPGEEYQREDGSIGVSYHVKRVFDISQTNARTAPTPAQPDMRLLLKAMIQTAPCPVELSDQLPDGVGAVYSPGLGKIGVRKGMGGPELFRSLAQEIAHVHLARDGGSRNDHALTAYSAAYILCRRYGVETGAFRFQAIPEVMGSMDARTVRDKLENIHNCANGISLDMSRVLEKAQKERSSGAR